MPRSETRGLLRSRPDADLGVVGAAVGAGGDQGRADQPPADGALGGRRDALSAPRLDRRGDREAARRDQGGLPGHLGAPDRADGARGAGRGAAADLPRDARGGLRPPGRRPADLHRLAPPATSWSSCWRGSSTWTAASAPPTRSARTACSPASSAARSCTARARSRRCAGSPTSTTSTSPPSYAYSDSVSDLPMLRAVGNPVVVNPDEELTRIAREEGWRVMRFERLGAAGCALAGPAALRRSAGAGPARDAHRIARVDAEDLAFAGIARQAELIRAGEVSSRELVELYLERIERLDPRAERVHRGARRAGARRGRRRRRAPRRPATSAAARRPDRDQGQRRRRGRGRPGSAPAPSTTRPAAADGEMVRRLRAAGAVIIGKTTLPELAICGSPSPRRWGVTRNPWDTEPHAGRLERRQRRRRSPPGWSAPPRPPTAAARSGSRRPSAACSGSSRSAGGCRWSPHDHWSDLSARGLRDPHGRRHRAVPRRGHRRRRRPGRPRAARAAVRRGRARDARAGCGSRSPSGRRGRSCRRSSPTRSGPGSPRPRSCCARSATTSRRHEPELRARRQQLRPPLPGRDPRRRRRGPPSGAARAAHPRLRPARRARTRAAWSAARRGPPPPTPRGSTAAGTSSTSWSRRRSARPRSRSAAGAARARCGPCSG